MSGPVLAMCLLLAAITNRSSANFQVDGDLTSKTNKQSYIVYTGGRDKDVSVPGVVSGAVTMLTQVLGSDEEMLDSMRFTYKNAFAGFSAWLTKDQAETLSRSEGVVKVFPNKMLQLHTTRSWDFVGIANISGTRPPFSNGTRQGAAHDVIVGVLDTGVWPESKSFSDDGMSEVPSRWKGTCDNTGVSNASEIVHCNKKLIGVRNYLGNSSARDEVGHGTHTTSTIGGAFVPNASLFGFGNGTARGGFPGARLAIYKVCSVDGCASDAILAAFDDAIADGVDIISLSIGGGPQPHDEDPIAVGSFHAVEKNILVSTSAGNSGPDASTVENGAPWILTVAASTIDRKFSVDIQLGDGRTLQGSALNFEKTATAPLISGKAASLNPVHDTEASLCISTALDPAKVKGKIIVCEFIAFIFIDILLESLKEVGAAGVILHDDISVEQLIHFTMPGAFVKKAVMDELLAYTNSSSGASATISLTKQVFNIEPAPTIAAFSSRGPSRESLDILKPDIAAPGVNILAAWSPLSPVFVNLSSPVFSDFNIISGTSMACPHATAAAAYVKSIHPDWSPAAIKSALMTTARNHDKLESIIKDFDSSDATPFAFGSGQINPLEAANPGLVYDTSVQEYIFHLCATGYNASQIAVITGRNANSCSSSHGTLPQLNYPSILIPDLKSKTTVTRTVTNVGNPRSVYRSIAKAPPGTKMLVSPDTLRFNSTGQKLEYTIRFVPLSELSSSWRFGELVWTSGSIAVRSPVAIKR